MAGGCCGGVLCRVSGLGSAPVQVALGGKRPRRGRRVHRTFGFASRGALVSDWSAVGIALSRELSNACMGQSCLFFSAIAFFSFSFLTRIIHTSIRYRDTGYVCVIYAFCGDVTHLIKKESSAAAPRIFSPRFGLLRRGGGGQQFYPADCFKTISGLRMTEGNLRANRFM